MIWDETIGAGRRRGAGARPRHPGPPHRPRAATPAPTCSSYNARSPARAPQRRRHREGAVAGVPRRGVAAALRHGPGAAVDHRRHLRAPRRAVRRVEPAAQRREVRRRRCARAVTRTPATGSRWRWPSTGSTVATSCRTSTSSSACASTTTARCASTAPGRTPAPYVELRAELPVVARRSRTRRTCSIRAPTTPSPRCASPRGPTRPTTRADPLWSSTPEAERAFLNTEDLVRSDPLVGDDWR